MSSFRLNDEGVLFFILDNRECIVIVENHVPDYQAYVGGGNASMNSKTLAYWYSIAKTDKLFDDVLKTL